MPLELEAAGPCSHRAFARGREKAKDSFVATRVQKDVRAGQSFTACSTKRVKIWCGITPCSGGP